MDDIRKDFVGNEINVGDEVLYSSSGYISLQRGRVVGFTNKKIKIADERNYALFTSNQKGYYCTKFDNDIAVIFYTNPKDFRKALVPI